MKRLEDGNVQFELSGSADLMVKELKSELADSPLIQKDIASLIYLFQDLTKAQSLRLKLATINTNMCRKFHTDINDLRMLCTYRGPGTLWLKDENVNRKALNYGSKKEQVLSDENQVEQANLGSILILKGALYPIDSTNAIVHRSPSIEESQEQRVVLRIDTNEFLNFDL